MNGPGLNFSIIRASGEVTTVVVTNLTAFTCYFVTVTAFTGPSELAATEGKAIGPVEFQTLEEGAWNLWLLLLTCKDIQIPIPIFLLYLSSSSEPKDPPKNVIVSLMPEDVNRVQVTFSAPEEPNGNITAYFAYIYEKDQLVKNISLNIVQRDRDTLTAFIGGLRGGQNYSIQVKLQYILTGHTLRKSLPLQTLFLYLISASFFCPSVDFSKEWCW